MWLLYAGEPHAEDAPAPKRNDDIAGHPVISPLTVKTHITRSIAKLHVRDRVRLVILVYEAGLVRPGEGLGPTVHAARRAGEVMRLKYRDSP